jgi:hypothetical protein
MLENIFEIAPTRRCNGKRMANVDADINFFEQVEPISCYCKPSTSIMR